MAIDALDNSIPPSESPSPGSSATHAKPTNQFRRRRNYIWHQFQHSLFLLRQGDTYSAFEDLQRGCRMAKDYLLRPSKQIITSLLTVMGNARWSRHRHLWISILRYMAAMCAGILGLGHPLTHIMTHISSWEAMRAVALPVRRLVLDRYSEQLGPDHPQVLVQKQGLSVELMRDDDFNQSEAVIKQASISSGLAHGESSLARRGCLRRLANLYAEQKRYADAESVFEQVIAMDSEANLHRGPTHETSIFTCQNLSILHARTGNLAKSGYWARRESDLALSIYGAKDEYYRDCLKRHAARARGDPPDKWFSWLEVS